MFKSTTAAHPEASIAASGQSRVLLVDESTLLRQLFTNELKRDSGIDFLGALSDLSEAIDQLNHLQPDVIVLTLGKRPLRHSSLLKRLLALRSIPVIAVAPPTSAGVSGAIDLLENGAVDVLRQPDDQVPLDRLLAVLSQRIKSVRSAHIQPWPAFQRNAFYHSTNAKSLTKASEGVLAIAAGVGSSAALANLISRLPANCPGTVVVQHMPVGFTAELAARISQRSIVEVREAITGDTVVPGRVLIAPGGFHMTLRRADSRLAVEIKDGPPVLHERPSAELLFNSVAKVAGDHATAIMLGGLGSDGATGMLNLKKAGAITIAQEEETCVLREMPACATRCGAAMHTSSVERMVDLIQ